MPLVSMRERLDHAATNSYGIPAFNVNNLEQVQAVMAAADEVGAPVIGLVTNVHFRPSVRSIFDQRYNELNDTQKKSNTSLC